ncbi:uncharacterized protein E0L32_009262 [Thyridium curvatum]|uniref:non-specific serine/threonine protein kinase n=1 Tax=Thyridium curvatum TaxID=1093900 RepID=A0A507AX01_9PEZI|nr:uncharacterized protein E0L32_009262 [Thyridium curvatum]TPX09519.1 hypothetical protein E0L32_009262 [Thyridium curvatum]
MSSAALQSAPQTVASLNAPSLGASSPSARHYTSSHSSPAPEGYHANQPNATSSSSSRRPAHRDDNPNNTYPSSAADSPMSSRAAVSSPVAVPGPPGEYQSSSRRHAPPVAPPRTSSNRHEQSASRRTREAADRGTDSPRRTRDANGNGYTYAAPDEAASQSSRRRTQPAQQEQSQRSGSSRDARTQGATMTMPIRSQGNTADASTARVPSRETSEILNSMLVTSPEVDIERERERMAMAQPAHPVTSPDDDDAIPPPIASAADPGEDARRGGRSRHDHSKREKQTKFGEYILGNTIGEGEFGKVKLGWKQEGGVQVAIKLIKKDSLGSNPSRMAKIMREVAILKQLRHPNIVQLHKMEESERHYGIVLEYASGGELFDYILNHRYLKDNAARRLFAQLVSGVGYLHKKGIVHRDLKLENLLLDRNRNIIITDFGFANTFDPHEELSEEEEMNLSDRDFVKRVGLDKLKSNGSRKGDLMQTSCGSPCYAAPELVVSDSLYTGRKVDVWSCGVILYAMLAGYLPFDDDPANPEGDNINLLYKYIVNTPLTFPEYVTPHARDLLRRILVPNPRKRADLFEVARHSWLSEYAHVVEFITSSTTTPGEIQNTTVPAEDEPSLGRSASVREASKRAAASTALGGLATKQGNVDPEAEAAAYAKQQRDNKRRTVQVEYVPPTTATQRGEPGYSSSGKTRARSGSQGPVEVTSPTSPNDKPLPRDPPVSKDAYAKSSRDGRRPPSAHRNQNIPPTRPGRDGARAASDYAYMTSAGASGARPNTGGSMGSTGSRGLSAGGRASYGQPIPPTVAGTNVHGRIQQPKGSKNYVISGPMPQDQQSMDYGRPSISVPPKFGQIAGFPAEGEGSGENKGHRRSNTIGEIGGKLFGRSGSIFGGKNRKRTEQQAAAEKSRKYPPVSMSATMPGLDNEPRPSMESKRSRRSFSMGLGKKRSGSISGSQTSQEKHTRRFSLLPGTFSLKAIGIGKDYPSAPESQADLPIQEPPRTGQSGRYVDQTIGGGEMDAVALDGMFAQLQDPQQAAVAAGQSSPHQQRFAPGQYERQQRPSGVPNYMQQGAVLNTGSDSSIDNMQQQQQRPPRSAPYSTAPGGYDNPMQAQPQDSSGRISTSRTGQHRGVLQKNNKHFRDAYDTDDYSRQHDHSGSSGAARRVMDFFRRRGKARGGEDR